jgi:hypothetical protein
MSTAGQPLRNETPTERLDRNWVELLQEMRVMQTGVQLIAGFLLTLPFQSRFTELDRWQEAQYLALVCLSGLTIAFLITPIALHRRIFGNHVKHRLVATGHVMVTITLGAIALLMAGIVAFVFDVVVGRDAGLVAGGASLLVMLVLLVGVPTVVARRPEATSDS